MALRWAPELPAVGMAGVLRGWTPKPQRCELEQLELWDPAPRWEGASGPLYRLPLSAYFSRAAEDELLDDPDATYELCPAALLLAVLARAAREQVRSQIRGELGELYRESSGNWRG
ncbi:unnamed protein product, partial [Polarella glacialis]